MVACALVVNDMKSDMTIDEFKRMLHAVARRLDGGANAEPEEFQLQRFHRGDQARPK